MNPEKSHLGLIDGGYGVIKAIKNPCQSSALRVVETASENDGKCNHYKQPE
jgi:hypothetical protein